MCSLESQLLETRLILAELVELLIIHLMSITGPEDWFLELILDEDIPEIELDDGYFI